jgi:hypothetical protein
MMQATWIGQHSKQHTLDEHAPLQSHNTALHGFGSLLLDLYSTPHRTPCTRMIHMSEKVGHLWTAS